MPRRRSNVTTFWGVSPPLLRGSLQETKRKGTYVEPLVNERKHAASTAQPLLHLLARLYRDDSGQDIVEYALIAVSMGLLTVAGVHGLAASISNDLTTIINAFNSATAGAS
jgi:Flp pilus assembly pilin Flp